MLKYVICSLKSYFKVHFLFHITPSEALFTCRFCHLKIFLLDFCSYIYIIREEWQWTGLAPVTLLFRISILSWSSRCWRLYASMVVHERSTSLLRTHTMFSKVLTFNSRSWQRRLSSATLVFSLCNCNSRAALTLLGNGVKEVATDGAQTPCAMVRPLPLIWLILSSRSLRDWWSSNNLWLATSRLWGCKLSRLILMPMMKCSRRFKCS